MSEVGTGRDPQPNLQAAGLCHPPIYFCAAFDSKNHHLFQKKMQVLHKGLITKHSHYLTGQRGKHFLIPSNSPSAHIFCHRISQLNCTLVKATSLRFKEREVSSRTSAAEALLCTAPHARLGMLSGSLQQNSFHVRQRKPLQPLGLHLSPLSQDL